MKKKWVGIASVLMGSAVVYWQNRKVVKTTYELPIFDLPKELEEFTIIQLSDIHFPNELLDTNHLTKQIAQQKPDIIIITGNLVTAKGNYDRKEMTYFIQGLVNIAPTYVVSGYHEYKMKHLDKLREDIAEAGGIYLENDTIWHRHKKSGVLIMGLDEKTAQQTKDSLYLRRIHVPEEHSYDVKILLAHHPEWFLFYHTEEEKLPDVTFSGYAKGGHVRLPVIGGLFSNNQGVLPNYTEGVYAHPILPDKLLVISRGIGTSKKIPLRVNNKPEMVVAKLIAKN
ncbi:metallophosphoesterase [Granulicatella sp. zg-ZJ]|uniref:metallophosphoesterase n=1 Tax=unclassified Granulicatella TaxID=2630493 RepID=UPI0013BFDAC4|nr:MULTISPECIES: metallophosphoesterase [unclassified Granulicatella]MBS4750017.1 metallophosphoesterase [Carnobacteriaceae bacterium zg-ZUI78]NEW62682.1 metallophosphoesterase [Granulicatella sp. zg-ZJ]NEW65829.1 metallophosphoesterase [Granulicatella sp. zg-84]QMI86333.1 metallophosphoesterase [Carnobacteriaceae bacterium zg-84]